MMSSLDIAVVGGGVGGLAAAAGLAGNGHKVTVYERSKTRGGVGFAFRITTNSDRCLRHLGIDTVAGGACVVDGGIQHAPTGEVIRRSKENQDDKDEGSTSVFAYRGILRFVQPQILQQLWDAAVQNGARIETGAGVKAVDSAKTTITLEDGKEIKVDLVVGADGVHVADAERFRPVPTGGMNCFRFMISTERAQQDDLLAPFYQKSGDFVSWMDMKKGKFLIAYQVDFGRQINLVCTHPQELSDAETETGDSGAAIDYNQKVSASKAIELYSDFEPRARRFLELADPDGFRIWKLMDMDALPRWSVNNTVLLGDCCHAVLPFGFSGASMAIEDATVLAMLLPADVSPSDIPARLSLYEEIRRPRVDRVRETSRAFGKGQFSKELSEDYRAFLQDYDAVEDARARLAKMHSAS